MSSIKKMKRKPCQAEVIANYAKVNAYTFKRFTKNMELGCALLAKHSDVMRELDPHSTTNKLILQVCNRYFEVLHDLFVASETKCCPGTEALVRINFRRNYL